MNTTADIRSTYIVEGFEPVIGLEVHAQLATQTKIFCGCKNLYGAEPNTQTCPTCLALPGALPVLNRVAVEYAMSMILAVGGEVQPLSIFARKNYFYPDLPKGYQISQYDKPTGLGGQIEYRIDDGSEHLCRLIRIHLEEDAGKSLHAEQGESYSRVDLNRCGAPLIEIVSQPDIRSPQEAYGYLMRLKQMLQYTGVCTGDMEKGHLRCDANVSVRPVGSPTFGTRTELKNLNSFKGVERAITYEINRQVAELRAGGTITQATMLWNEAKQRAEMMRSKEDSHDYRYFPDPDLVPLHISDEWRESVRRALPELPTARAQRFVSQYGLRPYDGIVLTDTRALADYYESMVKEGTDPVLASNWLQTEILGVINAKGESIDAFSLTASNVAGLLKKIGSGELSGKMAKEVFAEMLATGKDASAIIAEKGLVQISDESAIEKICAEIIAANPESLVKYKSGKTNLFAFFVGQVMKATKGQANPAAVNSVLTRLLEKA